MEVEARAPGKVILFGEHSVVHGSAAVAASVGLYTHVRIRCSPELKDAVSLKLLDLNVHLDWPLEVIKGLVEVVEIVDVNSEYTKSGLLARLETLVDHEALPEAKVGVAAGVVAFLLLYASILGCRSSTVIVTSELPMGSGLGSSASFCVALSAALLTMAKRSDACNPGEPICCSQGDTGSVRKWLDFDESETELINTWAYEGEKIVHGVPSGIDNTVSSFGNLVKFKKGNLMQLQKRYPLRMIITDTKVGRNTKALVAGVSGRAIHHPRAMAAVFEAVNAIAEEAVSVLQLPMTDGVSYSEQENRLEELVEMNQGLLQCMGVSHQSIDAICRITSRYQLHSKLTGAGGGGCVLTFLPQQISTNILDRVKGDLEAKGYDCFEVSIGCKGVQVSWIT